ncbi:hypothetical protein CLR69_21125 [Pectobacterium zantedeschiae]|uniref:Uncharacterized protein n=1 Tax=Pectobacterium zantedeschiae TaxID=2034769 RepID=A0A9X8P374_9GAMM|nr:hypothetical protein CLR69_21125 [Pectobacterium zantedeschiae]
MRWLSSLTPVTYLCKLLGIHCVAAFLQLELFRLYKANGVPVFRCSVKSVYGAKRCICIILTILCYVLRNETNVTASAMDERR